MIFITLNGCYHDGQADIEEWAGQGDKIASVLSFCPAWTTATAYSLDVDSFSLIDCRKVRTQLHDLSVGQKNLTMSNPFFSRYTGYQSGHGYSAKFPRFASMYSQALDHNTSPNFSISTLPLEISFPPQTHAFSRFFVLIPKHLVRDHSHMSVSLHSPPF